MKIACLQNHPMEGPAAIGEWVAERGSSLRIFKTFLGEFPAVGDADALVVMGGPMSVNDAEDDAFVAAAIETTSDYLKAGKPTFGICLGAQMMAVAAGGRVVAGPEREIGWFPISILPDPEGHPLSEVIDGAVVFHWHSEQIELPPQATLLASTAVCPVQAFHLEENQLGLQCHFEVSEESIKGMLTAFEPEVLAGGVGVQTAEEMRMGMVRFGFECRDSLFRILDRWTGLH